MKNVYDKKGRPICVGDILKVYHFTGQRNKKFYMYKMVKEKVTFGENQPVYFKMDHLENTHEYYHMKIDGSVLQDHEIVQGHKDGIHFEDREKLKTTHSKTGVIAGEDL